jgi:hypothetical protein
MIERYHSSEKIADFADRGVDAVFGVDKDFARPKAVGDFSARDKFPWCSTRRMSNSMGFVRGGCCGSREKVRSGHSRAGNH